MLVKYAHHGRWRCWASNPRSQLRSPTHQPLGQLHVLSTLRMIDLTWDNLLSLSLALDLYTQEYLTFVVRNRTCVSCQSNFTCGQGTPLSGDVLVALHLKIFTINSHASLSSLHAFKRGTQQSPANWSCVCWTSIDRGVAPWSPMSLYPHLPSKLPAHYVNLLNPKHL